MAFLNGEQQNAKYTPELNYAYELITVIANEGRSDLVMNAARSAGAKGGTVLHGKAVHALQNHAIQLQQELHNANVQDYQCSLVSIAARSSLQMQLCQHNELN